MRRRTLKFIEQYPSPEAIYKKIMENSWPYTRNREFLQLRDRALVALTYLLALRVSEVLRLKKSQFVFTRKVIIVQGIRLSKSRWKVCKFCRKPVRVEERRKHLLEQHGVDGDPEKYFVSKPRASQFRPEAWLPVRGKRAPLTLLVLKYLVKLKPEDKLFPITRVRAWQIITHILGEPPHWLRAYGENYLYDKWKHDLLAVADYVKVDPKTLQQYIRSGYRKYRPV